MKLEIEPPDILIDPDGEGIYVLADPFYNGPNVLLLAAAHLELRDERGWADWRSVAREHLWMVPSADGETWQVADIGKRPRGWRLNLPKKWRPVAYAYCTPPPD